jgi:hypothetical protein
VFLGASNHGFEPIGLLVISLNIVRQPHVAGRRAEAGPAKFSQRNPSYSFLRRVQSPRTGGKGTDIFGPRHKRPVHASIAAGVGHACAADGGVGGGPATPSARLPAAPLASAFYLG